MRCIDQICRYAEVQICRGADMQRCSCGEPVLSFSRDDCGDLEQQVQMCRGSKVQTMQSRCRDAEVCRGIVA